MILQYICPYIFQIFSLVVSTKCYGIYDTKHMELLTNKYHQMTEELWTQGRNDETDTDFDVAVKCTCCKTYSNWKSMHPGESIFLQNYVTREVGYEVVPNEKAVVLENGMPVEYTGIIHSTSCTGTATLSGDHPYQCNFCHTLTTESRI